MKNEFGKTVGINDAYEIWQNNTGWTWYVLKKYQANDDKAFARWYCWVTSPIMPNGEFGDEYVENITENYLKGIKNNPFLGILLSLNIIY